jgi:alcohol dehydrogenase
VLPQVVRWNGVAAKDRYAALLGAPRRRARDDDPAETLARRLEDFAVAGHMAITLSDAGVDAAAIPELAQLAAQQWTGTFNPRSFDAKGAEEIYRAAL